MTKSLAWRTMFVLYRRLSPKTERILVALTYIHLSLYSIENTCKYSYCIYHANARWEYGKRDASLLHTRKYMNRYDSVCIHSSRVTDPCPSSYQIRYIKKQSHINLKPSRQPFLYVAHSRFVFHSV
jgi:hypothetical protein